MGNFGILEGNITRRKKQTNKQTKKTNPQITWLARTSRREVAWMLESASSEQGMNRKARFACVGWRLGLNALRTI